MTVGVGGERCDAEIQVNRTSKDRFTYAVNEE